MLPPDAGRRTRYAGLLLLAGGGLWLQAAAWAENGSALPHLSLLAAAGLAFGGAHAVARAQPAAVPLLVVAVVSAFAAIRLDVLLGGPIRAPLGYSNAAGTLFMVTAGAGLMLAARSRPWPKRGIAAVLALVFAILPWLNASRTAAALVLLLPLGLLARTNRGVRVVAAASAGGMAVTLGGVVLLALAFTPGEPLGPVGRLLEITLSERRLMYWRDALRMVAENPLFGVGPGRYPDESPTAALEYYARWPHNEPLHFAAEAGLPGLLLFLGLYGWGFAWLWRRGDDPGAGVAALTLGAVAIAANVDFILHFPAVVIAAAALVGAGGATPAPSRAPPGSY